MGILDDFLKTLNDNGIRPGSAQLKKPTLPSPIDAALTPIQKVASSYVNTGNNVVVQPAIDAANFTRQEQKPGYIPPTKQELAAYAALQKEAASQTDKTPVAQQKDVSDRLAIAEERMNPLSESARRGQDLIGQGISGGMINTAATDVMPVLKQGFQDYKNSPLADETGGINMGAKVSNPTIPNTTGIEPEANPNVTTHLINTDTAPLEGGTPAKIKARKLPNDNFIPNPNPTSPTMGINEENIPYDNPAVSPGGIPTSETPIGGKVPPSGETATGATPISPDPLPQGPGRTITRITLKPSVYGAGNEAQVQNTIDQYVPGETATDQYKNLQSTLENFGKQIDYAVAKDPQTTTLHDVMTNYDKNLDAAGIYRTSTTSRGTLQTTAQKYVQDLAGISNNEGDINAKALADSLKKVNADAGPVFKKIAAGSKLTPQDEVILAARQTIRDSLTDMYGGDGGVVDTLLKKQGDLYDAADPLFDGREAEIKANTAAQAQAAKEAAANSAKSGVFGTMAAHPKIATAGLTVGALGLMGAGGLVINALNKNTQNPTSATLKDANSLITYPDAQPKEDGTIDPAPTAGTTWTPPSGGITFDQYSAQTTGAQAGSQAVANATKNFAPTKAAADAQLPHNVKNFMPNYYDTIGNINTLGSDVHSGKIDNNVLLKAKVDIPGTTSSMSVIDLATMISKNPNSSLAQQLIPVVNAQHKFNLAWNDITGTNAPSAYVLAVGDTPTQMRTKIAAQESWLKHNFQYYQAPFEAGYGAIQNVPTVPRGNNKTDNINNNNSSTPLPSTPPAFPSDFHFGSGFKGGGLPPIDKLF